MVLYRYRQKYAFQIKYFKKKKREKSGLMSLQYHGLIDTRHYGTIYIINQALIYKAPYPTMRTP